MKLSIIVPVYNVEQYLDECVASFFNQGLNTNDFEVLLIDDGSSDGSLLIAQNWGKRHQNIKVFHQENQGQAVARNFGIDNAKGDYLMFVDSDDYLLPGKIPGLIRLLESEKLDAVLYNLVVQIEDGSTVLSRLPSLDYDYVYSGEEVVLRQFVFGSVSRGIYLRDIFIRNSIRYGVGFAHEDSELCFRIYPQLSKIIYVEDVVYYYRYNSSSTDRTMSQSKVRYNIESDAIVISKVLHSCGSLNYSQSIQQHYRKIANSNMMAFLLRVKRNHVWSVVEFNDKIQWMKNLKIYPIKGLAKTWKSTLLLHILNIKPFLKVYLFEKI